MNAKTKKQTLKNLGARAPELGIPESWLAGPMPTGAIVGVAILAGAVRVQDQAEPGAPPRIRARKVLGGLPAQKALDVARSPWTSGPWAWVLEDVIPIEPIPCSGAQKIWRVPEAAAELVRAWYRAARDGASGRSHG